MNMKNIYTRLLPLLLCFVYAQVAWAASIEFDVTGANGTSYSGTYDVTLKGRTFTAGEWTGLCLPFDASKEVLDATFGENGYNIQEYSSYNETTNVISFKKVTAVKAGTPYFIKVSATAENPTFSNVTISSTSTAYCEVTLTSNLIFRGFYFKKWDYELYDSDSSNTITFYWLSTTGELKCYAKNEESYSSEGRPGVNAYFIRKNYNSSIANPTISFEGASSSGGSGEGGDTGGGDTGGDTGDQTSLAYKIAHKLQLTDVPTIYITLTTQSDNITDEALSAALYKDRNTGEAPYLDATVQVLDNKSDKSGIHLEEFTDEVQIKVRGNSTANPLNGKKAYRLKFPKKHKHDLLGLGYTKRNWTLLANVFDHSMIRNALTYHLNKEVGMDFCPGYKFVDVVINGNYRGTYQISDHVEADANRVNVNEDTGWMIEFQGRSDMLDKPVCFSQNGLQVNIKNPEPTDETDDTSVAAVVDPIKDWFINTWQPKWTSSSSFSTTNGWRSVNDEESLIKFWIVTELTGDYDGWMTVKAYKEADGDKLFYGPVWDKDLAYGNCSYENSDILVYNNSANGSSLTGYLQTIAKDPNFAQKVSTTLNNLLEGGLITRLQAKVDELAAIVAQTEELNNSKYPRNVSVGGLEVYDKTTYAEYVQLLKDYLSTRANTVKEQVATIVSTATTKQTITLDPTKNSWDTGYQSLYNYSGAYADVTVSPITAVDENWSTIFLPFDANESQLKAALGGDFELATLTSTENNTFKFTITTDKNISASTPYLVRMKSGYTAKTSWLFEGVIVTDVNDNAQSLNGDCIKASFHPQTPSSNTTAYYMSNGQLVQFDNQYNHQGVDNPIYSINGFHFYFYSSTTPSIEITDGSVEPAEHAQLTNLPTIYISGTIGDSWNRCGVEIYDKDSKIGGTKTYDITDATTGVQFQVQGSNSGGKDSFRFKFDKKTKMLSSGSYKQWVLASNDDDPTMARNALAWEMSKSIGLEFTPVYQFVDLYVNETYYGTYQLCDRVKVESGRALVSGGNKDNDWLVQLADNGEVAEESDTYIAATSTVPNIIPKNPDKDDLTADAYTTLISEMTSWFQNTLFKDIDSFSENVNQTQFINWYIAQELLCTYKGLSSIDLYRSVTDAAADQKAHFGPIWDSEKSFGNNDPTNKKHVIDMSDKDTDGSYDGLITEYADYKVMRRVLKNLWLQDWFADGVLAKWQTLYGSAKTTDLLTIMKNAITTIKSEIDQSAAKNYSIAGSAGTGWSLKYDTPYETAYTNLTQWLDTRFAYLDAKFKALAADKTLEFNTSKTDALDAWALMNGQTAKVHLKKRGTIHGGEWNMFTVPFDLSAEGIQSVFGSDATVKEFTRTDETATTVGLYFSAASEVKAGVPYIIKPASDVEEEALVFNEVKLNLNEPTSVSHGSYTLNGTLNKVALTLASADDKTIKYLGTGEQANQLVTLSEATNINGCRAYFKVQEASAAKSVVFMDDEATSIIAIDGLTPVANGPVYNLQGQQLGTSLNALPHGIYIVNGKKVMR